MIARKKGTNGHAGAEPVRVFVGTSAGDDAEACCAIEYTLRERSSALVKLAWLRPDDSGRKNWPNQGWTTPWTGYRWAVPELAGWFGRAVYMDCPQVVLGDVAALANSQMPDNAVALIGRVAGGIRTGVMVWDCERARHVLPSLPDMRQEVGLHQRLSTLLAGSASLAGELPPGWDVRDTEYSADPSRATGSAHFANLALQPHQSPARKRLAAEGREHWFKGTRLPHFSPGMVSLWQDAHERAVAAGYDVDAYVLEHGEAGKHRIAGAQDTRRGS